MENEMLTDCTLRSTVLWITYVRICEYTLCMKRCSVCVGCCAVCALYMYNKTEQIWQDGAVSDRMGDGNVVCVWCGVG